MLIVTTPLLCGGEICEGVAVDAEGTFGVACVCDLFFLLSGSVLGVLERGTYRVCFSAAERASECLSVQSSVCDT